MSEKTHSRSTYILMSTLILPGLGQCVMKRWAMGTFFSFSFLISALIFLLTLLGPLVKNVIMLTDMNSPNEVTEVAWQRALFWLGATLLVYFVNLADIIVRTKSLGTHSSGGANSRLP